ncbi:hypothetical protein GOP47_0016511, partial [Adiantum capillus-veneris]
GLGRTRARSGDWLESVCTGATSAGQGNSGKVQVKQTVEINAPSKASSQKISSVPASPKHQSFGGSASIQPRRTPVTEYEIEAIMLGGAC